jgi:hypothetical protein
MLILAGPDARGADAHQAARVFCFASTGFACAIGR